jgi:hypothetical protein
MKHIVVRDHRSNRRRRIVKITGFVVLGIATATMLGALVLRGQIARHGRDLFSSHPLRRMAALSFLARRKEATIDAVQLLRDFVATETRPLLRRRARKILARMERRLQEQAAAPIKSPGEVAG